MVLNARRSTEEIKLLADVWYYDCKDMDEQRFVRAIAACRKRSKWFPTPADVNEEYNTLLNKDAMHKPSQIELSTISPEEEERRLKKIRRVLTPSGVKIKINEKYKPKFPKDPSIVYAKKDK